MIGAKQLSQNYLSETTIMPKLDYDLVIVDCISAVKNGWWCIVIIFVGRTVRASCSYLPLWE